MTTKQSVYLIIYEDFTLSTVSELGEDDYLNAWNADITIVNITNPKRAEMLAFHSGGVENSYWEPVAEED